MISYIIIGVVVLGIILFIILANMYKTVPTDSVDVIVQNKTMKVYSANKQYNPEGVAAYFKIPSWFFIFKLGMVVHRLPLSIIPIKVPNFLSYDKDRARFVCNIVAYVTVSDPKIAATRFSGSIEELSKGVSYQIQATTRDVTTKKFIREIINDRKGIIDGVYQPLTEVLAHWGLDLKDIEIVDIRDPAKGEIEGEEESHVIRDISSIIETQISSEARQKNAEQNKIARLKEAESEELAKKREIEKEELISTRDQQRIMKVAEQQKLAREKELDVAKVQQVKTQEIEKERQIVIANQNKEVQAINKDNKRLEGEGDKERQLEQAKGTAAILRENGLAEADAIRAKYLAEAEGKEKLQAALNKFEDKAIRALVAEKIVEMQRAVGIEGAKALQTAEMKVFAGSDAGNGFDIGKAISATQVSNLDMATSIMNRIGKPNDLGINLSSKKEDK